MYLCWSLQQRFPRLFLEMLLTRCRSGKGAECVPANLGLWARPRDLASGAVVGHRVGRLRLGRALGADLFSHSRHQPQLRQRRVPGGHGDAHDLQLGRQERAQGVHPEGEGRAPVPGTRRGCGSPTGCLSLQVYAILMVQLLVTVVIVAFFTFW